MTAVDGELGRIAQATVLDGGLGTQLADAGVDVRAPLWSAQALIDAPDAVLAVHRAAFAAGADVAITASYQVSVDGFARAGLDAATAHRMLRRSVDLARRARDEAGRGRVAASVGPYGAMLADGSEYTGDYGLDVGSLRRWHRDRLRRLADAGADLLAVETIPSLREVEAIAAELEGLGVPAWVSVTPADGRMRTGEPLAEAFAVAAGPPEVVAVGVNCCHPDEVAGAVAVARAVAGKPVVAYPNSGEVWDASSRTWHGAGGFDADAVRRWHAAGAELIGGCCRTGPAEIAAIARALRPDEDAGVGAGAGARDLARSDGGA
ncbi:homocysteine S-methyltransferase [Agromyces sp. MMS24-K17]|uniref:homocysteine S-methyltransferase n=1 Tax=Agromyces sp. MMS24-K17 TaxID=3372850 RepID=UPI00375536EF